MSETQKTLRVFYCITLGLSVSNAVQQCCRTGLADLNTVNVSLILPALPQASCATPAAAVGRLEALHAQGDHLTLAECVVLSPKHLVEYRGRIRVERLLWEQYGIRLLPGPAKSTVDAYYPLESLWSLFAGPQVSQRASSQSGGGTAAGRTSSSQLLHQRRNALSSPDCVKHSSLSSLLPVADQVAQHRGCCEDLRDLRVSGAAASALARWEGSRLQAGWVPHLLCSQLCDRQAGGWH